jgi:hypothetical protein
MQKLLFLMFLSIWVGIAGCTQAPSTAIYVVVTATPLPEDDVQTMTSTSELLPSATPSETPHISATPTEAALVETLTPSLEVTTTPNIFPTTVTGQIQVAEQTFEKGRMFWIGPEKEIWIALHGDGGQNENRGIWVISPDSFDEDVDPEDPAPSLTPPPGFWKPIRGFGQLWNANEDLQYQLGWATGQEYGYSTPYTYQAGGEIVDGEYIEGPGVHSVVSLGKETFYFDESNGTWWRE